MSLTPLLLIVCALGVFVIGFMKGAFGGGFAIVGIPLLALVMDPITAGAILAPLFVAMDLVALRYWKPSTWSAPDLVPLLPGLVAGVAAGFFVLRDLDRHLVEILMAAITLVFCALWLRGGVSTTPRPRSSLKALVAGGASGVTTMVAHSGGPPLAIYLLPRGLDKATYAGTTSLFFTIGNLLKAGPWLLVGRLGEAQWILIALCLPVAAIGVWAGWRLHQRLDQAQLYRACYALLAVTALKLLWDGMQGFLG
ncbi:MAG: sulfite exporter TauE/SafE family protein [Pseudomonadota bacterium]